jgi:hypothetical protein
MPLLLQVAGSQPLDCVATGLCGATGVEANPVLPGVMFLAVGLVAAGIVGLRTARRRSSRDTTTDEQSPSPLH